MSTTTTTTTGTTHQEISSPMQVTSLGNITTTQKAVIAIDFGTTYSGTARVYTSDPSHVNCASLSSSVTGNVKEETVLLETPEGWYFGKDAVEKFNELKDSDLRDYDEHLEEAVHHHQGTLVPFQSEYDLSQRGIHLYRFFKAGLSNIQDGNFETATGKSTAGKDHSLLDLVAKSLKFLDDFAFTELTN